MRHVYTARDEMDASFVQGLLRQEGIEAVVQGQALGEVWGTLPLTAKSLPAVWVDEKDVERAVRQGMITVTESRQFLRFYETGLEGYTYLEEPSA